MEAYADDIAASSSSNVWHSMVWDGSDQRCMSMQLKKAKTGGSAQKPKAAAAPATGASAGHGILIESDSDDAVPAQQATARFGGRRLGELLPLSRWSACLDISVPDIFDRVTFHLFPDVRTLRC